MLEKILDLENEIVDIEKLDSFSLKELYIIRDEIALISNKTPEFLSDQSTIKAEESTYIKEDELNAMKSIEPTLRAMKNYRDKAQNKTTVKIDAFDALWAHINIAIAKKENLKL